MSPAGLPPEDPWDEDPDIPGPLGDEDEPAWLEASGSDHFAEDATRWPLTWRGLYPRERWLWFERLWNDACRLRRRYRLPIRSAWWEDDVQVEVLAALAAWVERYDGGEWDDPPGKLALLYDLERITGMLRDGLEPFHPRRDRPAFVSHVISLGAKPPPAP